MIYFGKSGCCLFPIFKKSTLSNSFLFVHFLLKGRPVSVGSAGWKHTNVSSFPCFYYVSDELTYKCEDQSWLPISTVSTDATIDTAAKKGATFRESSGSEILWGVTPESLGHTETMGSGWGAENTDTEDSRTLKSSRHTYPRIAPSPSLLSSYSSFSQWTSD